jgi:hypothetical protein
VAPSVPELRRSARANQYFAAREAARVPAGAVVPVQEKTSAGRGGPASSPCPYRQHVGVPSPFGCQAFVSSSPIWAVLTEVERRNVGGASRRA